MRAMRNDGGPAFPSPGVVLDDAMHGKQVQQGAYDGMSLREYAAVHALEGILASNTLTLRDAVGYAVVCADALLEELAK